MCFKKWSQAGLTHPDLPKAALPELDVQTQGLSGDLPSVLGQTLSLGLQYWANVRQTVTQSVGMLCRGRTGGVLQSGCRNVAGKSIKCIKAHCGSGWRGAAGRWTVCARWCRSLRCPASWSCSASRSALWCCRSPGRTDSRHLGGHNTA